MDGKSRFFGIDMRLLLRAGFRSAQKFTGNPDDAEDAVLEAFIVLWRYRDRLDPERNIFRLYLLIVEQQALRIAMKAANLRAHSISLDSAFTNAFGDEADLDLPDTDPSSDPEIVLDRNESRRDVRKAIEELPPIYREVILLYYFEGLTTAEIAALLGIEEGTVRVRLLRARRLLKEILRKI